ncbi:hypothetical protein ONZ45_g9925 [Pleurotus djamor]|nr:hypothetical protein ONZ45_g9925 [Pleurotus djamor]
MANPQETWTESLTDPVEPASGCGSTLRPITSITTNRYHKNAQVSLKRRSEAPGQGEMPTYLPEHWSPYVHPEGKLYFCRHTKPVVITEADLYNPENLKRLTEWLEVIQRLLVEEQIFDHDNVELFIQLEDAGCAYYFIDHHTRTEFWLDAVDTESIGLLQVVSEKHLKLALTEHYWAHVEFYPSHLPGLSNSVFDELTSIFAHGKLDRLTSNLSTLPYSSDECSNYIKLLNAIKGPPLFDSKPKHSRRNFRRRKVAININIQQNCGNTVNRTKVNGGDVHNNNYGDGNFTNAQTINNNNAPQADSLEDELEPQTEETPDVWTEVIPEQTELPNTDEPYLQQWVVYVWAWVPCFSWTGWFSGWMAQWIPQTCSQWVWPSPTKVNS